MTAGALKRPNNVTSTFFNTAHLLPKDLRFEHGDDKLASCTGRHLTSLRPCIQPLTAKLHQYQCCHSVMKKNTRIYLEKKTENNKKTDMRM